MRVALVRIGNSRGIRIPKPLIEQCRLNEAVDLRVEEGRLVIAPAGLPRDGWNDVFRAAASSEDDELFLDNLPPNQFDRKEWKW